jgi:hypothetical protein
VATSTAAEHPHITAHIERSSWGHLRAGTGGSHPEIVGTYMKVLGPVRETLIALDGVDGVLAQL